MNKLTHIPTGEQYIAKYIGSEPAPLTPFGSIDIFEDADGQIRCFFDGVGYTDYKVEALNTQENH